MKKLIYGCLLVLAGVVGYGIYLFYQKPPDTREEKAEFEITAEDLVKEFSANEGEANRKFVDKVLIISGKVEQIQFTATEASVMLSSHDPMSGVTCSFYSDEIAPLKDIGRGKLVKIKGKCTGKLMDVVLNNCSLAR